MNNPNHKKYIYTVGILIFHRTPELVEIGKKCLASVLACIDRDTTQLIIVDNGSTARDECWEREADIYVRYRENRGVSAGWNGILKLARGEFICILGDDTEVPAGYLEAMHECFKNDDCGVSNPYVEHLPRGLGIVRDYKWFSGACFMLSQRTVYEAGYFRENLYFPTNFEDTDYWCRVMKGGKRLYKNFSAKVKHLEGQTTKATDLDEAKQGTRQTFLKEWGFDPVPYFCYDKDIYQALGIEE